ncbi:hypothetical protein FGADI_4948 [Fusarium gaditjirri]|uniref:Uncharacterized protein n=1 Tax=Fusarium gaditjirri TaxID=282569 RepID=A0A8H4TBJ9_9HYPO|nr:hypothetical protein FGADI_4948 [Fusarium gaditjirri]
MTDMSYEDTQHLLDSIASPELDQHFNDPMGGNPTVEVQEDIEAPMIMGHSSSSFQNHQAQHGVGDEALLASNPFEKEFTEAYEAGNARIPTSSGSDAQLSSLDNNGSTIGDDDSPVPVSTAVTPATRFSSPMNPENYLAASFQAQPYQPLNNQAQSYPVPMGQPYDQMALQQMQPFPGRQSNTLGGRQIRQTQYPQQQLISMNNQFQQPLLGQASHPAFQVSQPRNLPSQAQPRKGPAPGEPTRHKIPVNPANIKSRTLEQQSLLSELEHFSHEYQGYITNPVQARQIGNLFLSLAHHEVEVTPPAMDPTFPRSHEAYRARVQELFMAIVDWSNPRGWRTKMGSKLAAQWVEEVTAGRKSLGLSVEPSDMLDHQIEPPLERMPPVAEQWKNVVHRQLSNIEIEILSSKILYNKVLIHSALRSSWLSRITNSPVAELVRKENNKAGNDKKRNAANRQNGKGVKRSQNEESGGEEDGRKTKRKRN